MNLVGIVRSVLSVLAGYFVFAGSGFLVFKLSNQPAHQAAPVWFMITAVALGMLFSLLGGYLSGLLAGRNPLWHAVAVAVLLALGASVSLASTIGHGAIWSQVAALTLMAPSAVAGGWVGRALTRKQSPRTFPEKEN